MLLEDPQGPHGDGADPGSAGAENPSGSELHRVELSKDALRNLSKSISKINKESGELTSMHGFFKGMQWVHFCLYEGQQQARPGSWA